MHDAERDVLLEAPAPCPADRQAARVACLGVHRVEQAGLADAGRALDDHHAALAGTGPVEERVEFDLLVFALERRFAERRGGGLTLRRS